MQISGPTLIWARICILWILPRFHFKIKWQWKSGWRSWSLLLLTMSFRAIRACLGSLGSMIVPIYKLIQLYSHELAQALPLLSAVLCVWERLFLKKAKTWLNVSGCLQAGTYWNFLCLGGEKVPEYSHFLSLQRPLHLSQILLLLTSILYSIMWFHYPPSHSAVVHATF